MSHEVIATCPVCAGELLVTRLRCGSCATTIEGEFTVGRFSRLSREQLALLESFLRSRGNLRDMERELGISYPTVRSRVEALIRALGFGPRDEATDPTDGAGAPGTLDASGAPGQDGQEVEPAGSPNDQAADRREILEQLSRGELSAEQAAAAIRGLGRTKT
jgi:hypothetical protein